MLPPTPHAQGDASLPPDQQDKIARLFSEFGRGVGNYVLARLGDPELAEEITARVFLQVVRGYVQLRGSAVHWLWAIVRNELAKHFRQRRAVPLDDDLLDARELPADAAARGQLQAELQAALARLPEEAQQIVFMKFFQDMKNLEIAEATGLTPSNVGVTIHRTLKQLRRLMTERPACT